MPKRPSKNKPAQVAGFTPGQVKAAVDARDRAAAGNPQAVRGAFLGGQPIKLGTLEIQPLTIGTFWLLEETGNPLAGNGAGGDAPVSFRQLAEAAFILTNPQQASDAWSKGREVFTAAAFGVACRIPVADLQGLTTALYGRVAEAQETMPPEAAGDGKRPLADSPPQAPA